MILSTHNTLLEDIQLAKKEGYTEDFMYADKKIIGRSNKKEYSASECILIEYCRHEGASDPDDASILFLIQCADGTKGCLSSAYGRFADTALIDFVMSLQKG